MHEFQVIPKVTSLGLNEQELAFLSRVMNGPHQDIFDTMGRPEVHKVTDIMTWILKTYGKDKLPQSRLTRVHFHSLTFHMLSVQPESWSNIKSAVAAGSRAAGLQACDTDILNQDLSELRIPDVLKLYNGGEDVMFDVDNPVMTFGHDGFQFALSPVLVCKNPLKTVGLGDAISATGLLYSTYRGVDL
ncbi:hypothetical protein LSH36_374g04045 [Paralvinella palmiformis]|uniref:ADP-dependent glucokinase n=1 Tax=Paralvinella palmiformis TaxID=53620 RepID=A0AAD9N135_9ANNE|nr:hypothetical protein LSH36_374g04045 [Paralvinella palmiformis]